MFQWIYQTFFCWHKWSVSKDGDIVDKYGRINGWYERIECQRCGKKKLIRYE